jgi:hypothetical protein
MAVLACGRGEDGGSTSIGPPAHALSVQISGDGTVTSAPAGIDCGKACTATFTGPVTLTATPATGSTFSGWDGACSGTGGCAVAMSGDASVRATFRGGPPPPSQSFMLKVTVQGSGSVTSSPPGMDCGSNCSSRFSAGTRVALTATAAAGSRFVEWSGGCSGAQDCSVTLRSDTEVHATFQPEPPPPADACDGLMPTRLPQPVVATMPNSDCGGGTSDDGTGNFALSYQIGPDPMYPVWQFFTIKDGAVVRIGETVVGGDETGTVVWSQPSGFTVYQVFGGSGASNLTFYTHEGQRTSSSPLTTAFMGGGYASAAAGLDPSGGIAATRNYRSGNDIVSEFARFSKTGTVETEWVPISKGASYMGAVGIALSGHALVVENLLGRWHARWLDRDGSALSEWFEVSGTTIPGFHFLMDGSLVMRSVVQHEYKLRFEDAKASASDLPEWLQQRSVNQFSVVRFGKGYASWGDAGPCRGKLEVLATSGKSCGCLEVPSLSRLASIGRDGSLLVPRQDKTCKYDLYPQLLK